MRQQAIPDAPAEFQARVHEIVRAIPPGQVMTYGGIASLIPPPPGVDWESYARLRARWAGYAMAACPDDLPWQRVVNAQGKISPRPGRGPHEQRLLLEREGMQFDEKERLDLSRYVWSPPEEWLRGRGLLARPSAKEEQR